MPKKDRIALFRNTGKVKAVECPNNSRVLRNQPLSLNEKKGLQKPDKA